MRGVFLAVACMLILPGLALAQSPTPTPTPTPIPASSILPSSLPTPGPTPTPPMLIELDCWQSLGPPRVPCNTDTDPNWYLVPLNSTAIFTAAAVPDGAFSVPNPIYLDFNCDNPSTCVSKQPFSTSGPLIINANVPGEWTAIVNIPGYWSNELKVRVR
jgi:hypothetical protein